MSSLKSAKFLSVLALTLPVFLAQINSSVAEQTVLTRNDHAVLANHHKDLVEEAEAKLQKYQAILKDYEERPYYYGRQGQDLRSHTIANIREYQNALKENLGNAEFHQRMTVGQDFPIHKAAVAADRKL